ncbi:MAG: DUF1320 family protein [Magnetococcales bacterium]|nr:DUF1320 family protein [Magnetococcales bacterium]
MPYAQPVQMLLWFGARELAQVAVPEELTPVSPELLRLTLEGGNRAGFTADQTDAADVGASALLQALEDASRLIDSYLVTRQLLPLSDERIAQSPLPRLCGEIARRLLHRDRIPEAVQAGYERAMAWLASLGAGQAGIAGGATGVVAGSAGSPAFDAAPRAFDDTTLWGF